MIITTLDGEEVVKTQVCSKCGIEKPLSAFSLSKSKSFAQRGIKRYDCKYCVKQNQKIVAGLKSKYKKPKHGSKCPICNEVPQTSKTGKSNPWCLDHDHTTNKFRGWLCLNCNRNLGMFGDDVETLKRAIDYLTMGE